MVNLWNYLSILRFYSLHGDIVKSLNTSRNLTWNFINDSKTFTFNESFNSGKATDSNDDSISSSSVCCSRMI